MELNTVRDKKLFRAITGTLQYKSVKNRNRVIRYAWHTGTSPLQTNTLFFTCIMHFVSAYQKGIVSANELMTWISCLPKMFVKLIMFHCQLLRSHLTEKPTMLDICIHRTHYLHLKESWREAMNRSTTGITFGCSFPSAHAIGPLTRFDHGHLKALREGTNSWWYEAIQDPRFTDSEESDTE